MAEWLRPLTSAILKNLTTVGLAFVRGACEQVKNITMSFFKSNENIQKKEDGPDRSVSDNQSSSVIPNKPTIKAKNKTVISFQASAMKS